MCSVDQHFYERFIFAIFAGLKISRNKIAAKIWTYIDRKYIKYLLHIFHMTQIRVKSIKMNKILIQTTVKTH